MISITILKRVHLRCAERSTLVHVSIYCVAKRAFLSLFTFHALYFHHHRVWPLIFSTFTPTSIYMKCALEIPVDNTKFTLASSYQKFSPP